MGIIRSGKQVKTGQRSPKKRLVNGIGSKANKHKSKGYGNQAGEAQKIQQKLIEMKEARKNEMG